MKTMLELNDLNMKGYWKPFASVLFGILVFGLLKVHDIYLIEELYMDTAVSPTRLFLLHCPNVERFL